MKPGNTRGSRHYGTRLLLLWSLGGLAGAPGLAQQEERTSAASADRPSVVVRNKGVGGQTALDGLKRFDADVLASKPRHLVLYFGINDACNQNIGEEAFENALRTLVERARRGGIETVVLVTPNPIINAYIKLRHADHPAVDDLQAHLDRYDQVVRRVAAECQVPLADLRRLVDAHGGASTNATSLIRNVANARSADGVHLTAEGYRLLAGLLAPLLQGRIQPGDEVVCLGDSLTYGAAVAGAGTALGETYPAQLAILLNRPAPVGTLRTFGGEPITLSNALLSVQFYPPEQGGGIRQIRDERGFAFVHGGCTGPLWRATLKRIPRAGEARPEWTFMTLDPEKDDGTDATTASSDAEEWVIRSTDQSGAWARRANGVVLVWTNLAVGDERAALDVTIEATLAPGDPFLRFRTRFVNRSQRFTVFSLTAPQVDGIYPADGQTDRDRLASPIYGGRLMVNPIMNGILGKPSYFMPNRGGHCMQFDAYYHDDHGLFLGCQDGQLNVVRTTMAADASRGLSWGMVHVPNNMKIVPQEWATPYDTVLRCFQGDWYDACRIYRDWALKQYWAAEGPLYTRASIPTWFKEIDEWLIWNVNATPPVDLYTDTLRQAFAGLNIGLSTHHWGKGHHFDALSPERFPLDAIDRDYLQKAKNANYSCMGYIQSVAWDTRSPSYTQFAGNVHTIQNFYHQRVNVFGHAGAFPGATWGRVLGDTIEKMAGEAGFRAAYLDSGNHGGTYLNFNPLYGNDSGGGTAYIHGQQALILNLRKRARAINPDFCFTAESFWEGNIAVLDGFLDCNTTNIRLKKNEILAIPMVQAVYHDYALLFSAWVNRQDLEQPGARGYLAKFGQSFVWGVKPAWNQPSLLTLYTNHPVALESSIQRYHAYAAARKFLVYGDLLRPPLLDPPAREIAVDWGISWGRGAFPIVLPVVQHALWRAPDGRVGLVLYNLGDERQTVTLRLEQAATALPQAQLLNPVWVYPAPSAALELQTRPRENGVDLTVTLAPRAPAVLEF